MHGSHVINEQPIGMTIAYDPTNSLVQRHEDFNLPAMSFSIASGEPLKAPLNMTGEQHTAKENLLHKVRNYFAINRLAGETLQETISPWDRPQNDNDELMVSEESQIDWVFEMAPKVEATQTPNGSRVKRFGRSIMESFSNASYNLSGKISSHSYLAKESIKGRNRNFAIAAGVLAVNAYVAHRFIGHYNGNSAQHVSNTLSHLPQPKNLHNFQPNSLVPSNMAFSPKTATSSEFFTNVSDNLVSRLHGGLKASSESIKNNTHNAAQKAAEKINKVAQFMTAKTDRRPLWSVVTDKVGSGQSTSTINDKIIPALVKSGHKISWTKNNVLLVDSKALNGQQVVKLLGKDFSWS